MKKKISSTSKKSKRLHIDGGWESVNSHAAGIDIGSREHWVCVPPGADDQPVRRFGTFTADLQAIAQWLQQCGMTTAAMEATGVYWIPLFQVLESCGIEVLLVNPRQIKHVSGRKTDVSDCQWIQRLHTYGLLQASFRPADAYCVLRTYLRYRDELVKARTVQCQHLQKSLQQMNLQLSQVLSDITGESGQAIIRAIVQGERDEAKLANMVNYRVRAATAKIQAALRGDYRPEHLFVLQQALELYDTYQAKILATEERIVQEMTKLTDKVDVAAKPLPARKPGRGAHLDRMAEVDLREVLYQKFGVDLTAIEGVGVLTSLTLLTEVGPDLSRFRNEKCFCSWLGLCPDNRISGGKVLSSRTRRVINKASDALRMAASSLERSQSALGAFFRRMKARLGAAEAITAAAHKLARLVYRLLTHGEAYVRVGMQQYEKKYQDRKLYAVRRTAKTMGYELVEAKPVA
jgi:transposase